LRCAVVLKYWLHDDFSTFVGVETALFKGFQPKGLPTSAI
jgi:hypothetical protein